MGFVYYILSVVVSYAMVRKAFIYSSDEYGEFCTMPLGFYLLFILIPFLNVFASVIALLFTIPDSVVDKFFGIKDDK